MTHHLACFFIFAETVTSGAQVYHDTIPQLCEMAQLIDLVLGSERAVRFRFLGNARENNEPAEAEGVVRLIIIGSFLRDWRYPSCGA